MPTTTKKPSKSSPTLSRITLDLPKEEHKKLKAIAAVLGKTMRELIIESIEVHLGKAKILNKDTLKAIQMVEKKKHLTTADDAEDLFKKLRI